MPRRLYDHMMRPMFDRLKARPEWKFFGVLLKADRPLAIAWWVALWIARSAAGAVRHRDGRAGRRRAARRSARAPLIAVGVVFVLLQVLPPLHQAVGANLGSRTAAWLYDQLTIACVRPPGMGHLEDPRLTTDLTMARDFDLGISGPPLSISMDFIASGLVEMVGGTGVGGGAGRLRLVGAAAAGGRVARRRIGCCAKARCGAIAIRMRFARRSATPTTPIGWRSIRRPPRNCGCSDSPNGRSSGSRRGAGACSICGGRRRDCASGRCCGACCWCCPRTSWCSGRWRADAAAGRLAVGHVVTFASAAVEHQHDRVRRIVVGARRRGGAGRRGAAPAGGDGAGRELSCAGDRAAREHAGARDPLSRRDASPIPRRGEPVLDGFDLTIPAGSSLAIVGQNGAGKTTLAKLLCRLYDPQEGAIEIDGVDLRELDLERWRARVTAVFQDFIRFELPLRDNVAPAGAPDDVIEQALAASRRGESRDLDTMLARGYEGGTDLSGGQWQRIALARALCAVKLGAGSCCSTSRRRSSTCAARAEIFERILAATRHATTILISHRFSTVRHADRICVLEHGKVVELGTHDELMAPAAATGRCSNCRRRASAKRDGEEGVCAR